MAITVAESMRANAALRRRDAPASELYTLGELNALARAGRLPEYDDGAGAVLRHWQAADARAALITQAVFDARVRALPAVSRVLSVPSIVLCGGSVHRMMCGDGSIGGSDLDYYVVGLDPGDEGALWRKAEEFLAALDGEGYSAVRMSGSALTVHGAPRSSLPKQQLILRAYPSVASVIQAFDLDPCCMAYDGSAAYLTGSAARSLLTGRMILDPSRRSTTYEQRLVKYMRRGVALIAPHLDPRGLAPGAHVRMPRLEFVVQGASGSVATVDIRPADRQPASDYEPLGDLLEDGLSCGMHCAAKLNVAALYSGRLDRLALVAGLADARAALAGFAEAGRATAGDLVPREAVARLHAGALDAHGFMAARNLSGIATLTKYLGLTPAAGARILGMVTAHGVVDIREPVRALIRRAAERYDELACARLSVWIKDEPGRQWTASVNPAFEDARDYYGDRYCEEPRGGAAAGADAAGDSPDDGAPDGCDVCPMCHEAMPAGCRNAMVLQCGHRMHLMPQAPPRECVGGFGWILSAGTCPMCRADATTQVAAPVLPPRARAPTAVAASASVLDD